MSVEFMIEMAWKSLVISGVAVLAFRLLRGRSSADRAAMLRLAMALLVALPLISVALPALQVEQPELGALVEVAPPERAAPMSAAAHPDLALQDDALSMGELALLGYVAGLLLLLARLLAGLWTLRRWTAAAAPAVSPAWTSSLARVLARSPGAGSTRLLVSDAVSSPLSWGWRRPVVLIDAGSLARGEDADAILAHEIAHLVRRDWPALLLSRLAVALFWFNPLVWMLERALIAEAEEAADLQALGSVEPVSYAQSLVACFRRSNDASIPANSIASGQGLARRIRAILDGTRRGTPSGSVWTLAAMAASVAVAGPVAALQLVGPAALPNVLAPAPLPPAPQAASFAAPMAPSPAVVRPIERLARARGVPVPPLAPVPPRAAEVLPVPPAAPVRIAAPASAFAVPPAPPAPPVPSAPRNRPAPLAEVVANAPVVSVDELISMKIHGLDAEYIEKVVAVSPHARRLTPDQLISMRIHGMTPARVRAISQAGERDVDIDRLVGKRMRDVRTKAIASARTAASASATANAATGVAARAVAEAMAEVDRGLSEIDD